MRQPRRSSVLLTALGLLAAGPVFAGWAYEAVTTDDAARGKPRVLGVRAWVDGAKTKVEFTDGSKQGPFSAGSYLLTQDGGQTLYLVDPKEKAYSRWDMEAMFQMLGNLMESSGGLFEMEFSDISSKKLLEEPGGSVLGYPTTHYRWQSGYTLRMSVMGMKREHQAEVLQDLWVTDAHDAAGFLVWLRPDRMKTGNQDFDALLASEMKKLSGFPLKSTTVTTTRDKKGRENVTRSTTEVTSLREEAIAGAVFELPADYEERPLLPAMAEGQDEAPEEEGGR